MPWSIARITRRGTLSSAARPRRPAEVAELARPVEEAAQRPVGRAVVSGSSISFTVCPARTASTVMPISIPKPSAKGRTSSQCRRGRWRAGPRSAPWRRSRRDPRSRRAAYPSAKPKPPPSRFANAATARSHSPALRPPRPAAPVRPPTSRGRHRRAGTWRRRRRRARRAPPPPPPSRSRPCRAACARLITVAPCCIAISAVPSSEASSASSRRAPGNAAARESKVSATRSASLRAAAIT